MPHNGRVTYESPDLFEDYLELEKAIRRKYQGGTLPGMAGIQTRRPPPAPGMYGGQMAGAGGVYGAGSANPFIQQGSPLRPGTQAAPNLTGAGPIDYSGQPTMPYQPEAPAASGMISSLAEAGTGLLDPSSAYSKRIREEIGQGIGAQSAARERAAALRAARSGLGAGASPELLETQADIGRAGLSAIGDATSGAMLGGIGLGGQLLSPALSGEIGLQGQRLSGFMGQQGLMAQQAQNQLAANMQAQQLQQEAMLRELMLMGGF